jgi:hypothetical protein
VNTAGEVVFQAQLDAGGVAIMSGDGGALTPRVSTVGPFSSLGDPTINAAGEIAFSAGLDAGGVGIYTGADPVANKVIASGDTLFGHTVNSISFFRGLNDSGQIAFYANFSDGTQDIFRADPTVPAPGALLTALMGAVPGAALLLRRRRKS